MTTTENQAGVELPQGLRGQFLSLRDRLWRIETVATACQAASTLVASCVGLYLSDRVWDTPVWLRAGFLAVGLGGATWVVAGWVKLWMIRPRDQRALAVLVQKAYRRLGDRLLGIVELADEHQRPAYFSPALYRAAINQVAAEAAPFDFAAAVDNKPAKRSGGMLLTSLGFALAAVVLCPPAALNALQRWLTPAREIPRYTLVALEGGTPRKVVAHGEAFEVEYAVVYRSIWRPGRAVWQFERQPRQSTTAGEGRVHARVPGQTQQGVLTVRLGDARARLKIEPAYRPSLGELSATVAWPGYLRHEPAKVGVEGGSLDILEGSRVRFGGRANRALVSAELQTVGQNPQALRVEGDRFESDAMDLDGVSEVGFRWQDHLGLAGAPWRLLLRSQRDVAPLVELPQLQKDSAILETEVLEVKTLARDDFGVRELGLDWQMLTEAPPTNSAAAAQPFRFQAPTSHEKSLEETFQFSPALLGIPPDSVVELRGFAVDNYPERSRSYTTVYRIHVVGNERHAELVRQNLESLLTRLEEITRLEEKVAAATEALQNLPKDKQEAKEAAERIAAAKEEQARAASNLEDLAAEGKKTLREAFRNPTFSEQTLRDWTRNMQEMQELSQQKMQQAAQSLNSAAQAPEERAQHLAQAAQKEQEILSDLENLQKQVNKGLDQLQALTLAQRLRKISADETDIATGLATIVPEIIGMMPRELPPRFKSAESSLAGDQGGAHQEIQVLQGEIGRFFERTQKDEYGQVSREMNEARVVDELERVRDLIQENIAMDAIQSLAAWSKRLTGWAEMLEPKSEGSGGGDGQGGGSADEALLKELLGLLRVRDREINLRQRTGLLDRNKGAAEKYAENAKSLATTQGQVREELGRIQGENPIPALEFPLQDIMDSMQEIEGMLNKPQTDRTTHQAQTKSIELLSDIINLINEQQQRSQSSSSSSPSETAEDMAFLMQMMQQQNQLGQTAGLNPNGGGSQAGGAATRPITNVQGDPNSKAGDARGVSRASGIAAPVPTEFRDALENYFRAVEKLESK